MLCVGIGSRRRKTRGKCRGIALIGARETGKMRLLRNPGGEPGGGLERGDQRRLAQIGGRDFGHAPAARDAHQRQWFLDLHVLIEAANGETREAAPRRSHVDIGFGFAGAFERRPQSGRELGRRALRHE